MVLLIVELAIHDNSHVYGKSSFVCSTYGGWNLEVYESIWRYIGIYGSVWKYMEVYGSICSYMEVYGLIAGTGETSERRRKVN